MTHNITWENLDWNALDRLRETFLAGTPPAASYWNSTADLAAYDLTYAQRIGWKWDAVVAELRLRGWQPPIDLPWLDWGCGSGIAGRVMLGGFGGRQPAALLLHDRSAWAMEFASERARRSHPKLQVAQANEAVLTGEQPIGLLVLSHVLNELPTVEQDGLVRLARRARAVVWVEPGSYEVSRKLIGMREELTGDFAVVAPCTHQAVCGLLTGGNERHWCHHFAAPPKGIMADSNWVRFAQRAGIDLRSLPYSFLVLEKKSERSPTPAFEGWSRIIGRPRMYKGFARVFSCQADGVGELVLQKRDAKPVFKELDEIGDAPLYEWTVDGDRITSARGLESRNVHPEPDEAGD